MKLTSQDIITLLIFIGTALILSRLFAELGKKLKLPVVLGELFVGIILGPTLFVHFYPELFHQFFPSPGFAPKGQPADSGAVARVALDGITQLAVIMLLFVAGLEVQLQIVLKQGKTAIVTSFTSMIIPFGLGFIAVWFFPQFFNMNGNDKLIYGLFFGIAMAVSALPVIARILMDLNIYRTKVGMTIMAAAVFDDLTGWLTFSFVLSMMNVQKREISNIWQSAALIIGFGLFMLVIGRRIINAVLPWVHKKLSWPGGVLALCLGFGFLGAAFTESIGLHAILGAFIVGIAIGDSVHFREEARTIIHQFVMNIFAPLFFVSIGLKVNFI
ncbi:MAG TPA: cation:proton antiporter, partial [Bacteroidia bacterium]|nr:cation:proton antiporter [Bacteroidia bacterium]